MLLGAEDALGGPFVKFGEAAGESVKSLKSWESVKSLKSGGGSVKPLPIGGAETAAGSGGGETDLGKVEGHLETLLGMRDSPAMARATRAVAAERRSIQPL